MFLDLINTHGKSLFYCIENAHKWESIWTWVPPAYASRFGDVGEVGTVPPSSVHLDAKIEQRMLSVHKMAKTLLKGQRKGAGKGFKGSYDKGSGKGKGQPKGKGKGQQWGKQQQQKQWGQKKPFVRQDQWKKPAWQKGSKKGGW